MQFILRDTRGRTNKESEVQRIIFGKRCGQDVNLGLSKAFVVPLMLLKVWPLS